MPQSYSGDLRERVIGTVEAGASRREAAELFQISISSAIRWVQRWRKEGSSEPKPRGGSCSVLEKYADRILALVAKHPDGPWTKYSRRCTSSGFRAAEPRSGDFSSATISPIKKSLCAAERHRKDVARARRLWIRQQGFLDTTRLVFIDETAITTNMVRVRGRCPRGERLVGHVPQGEWKTITFIAGLRHNRMTAPMVIEGAM